MNPRRLFLPLFLSLWAFALNVQAAAPDVSGSWKWDFERNGETREIAMKLKQDASKVSGTVTGPDGNTTEIREGKITEDGKLTFLLQIERDGNTMKINF